MQMGGETVNGTWLNALKWPVSRKSASENEAIGILAFEVAALMSKVVNLWHSLSDREVMKMKEWTLNSVGVKMLVSDDDYFLMELALNETLNNFEFLACSVARLGKRCKDPKYHGYEHFVHNPSQHYLQWLGWEYEWKKMERKVKKMERFVSAMLLLCQELEVLEEHEQTLKRMKMNPESKRVKLEEFKKKVKWQREQVENLRDMSPWNRSYDYVVRLLARSLFTILERIIIVFGNCHLPIENQQDDSAAMSSNIHFARSRSLSTLMHSSVHPYENNGFSSEFGWIQSKSKRKNKKQQKQVLQIGSFKGCMSGNASPVVQTCVLTSRGSMWPTDSHLKNTDTMKKMDKLAPFHRRRIHFKLSMKGRLKPSSHTLGDAALALHYANVIVLIEKIVLAPHLLDLQTRDDLYNMLPNTIRTNLRAKLKWYAKSKAKVEWNMVLTQILEWLAPLAHNMIKWHCERNFEKERTTCKANVLLVQTLYFANQMKTEAALVELLVGLQYECRVDSEATMRDHAQQEVAGSRGFDSGPLKKNELYNK